MPPGQGPIDPRPAFAPPPGPGGGWMPPRGGPWGPPGFLRPPRPGGFLLRAVLTTLLLVVLLDLIGVNLIMLTPAPPHVKKVTVVDSTAEQTIVVIPVEGLITDELAGQFDQYITAAEADKDVRGVVLAIDTPGGSASASDAMYHRLQMFKQRAKANGQSIPIVAAMGGIATSGGYYVACGADYIFAQPTTWTADIGVLVPRFNVSELLAKYGVKETTIVATGADYKNLGSMFEPEDEKGRVYLQGLVDATFDQFKKVVNDGRRGKLSPNLDDIFNGRVYMANDALRLGLIDRIGYNEDAYDYIRTAAGVSDAKIVRYEPPSLIEQALGTESLFNLARGKAQAPSGGITVNGVSVDLRQLGDLIAPRPMYLWRGN
jgi:protease IV